MDLEFIERGLGDNKRDDAKKLWNDRAEGFREMSLKNKVGENSLIGKVQSYIGALDKDTTVLDVGCGAGRYAEYFSNNSKKYLGIDISDKMIAYATEDYKDLKNVEFKVVDWNEESLDEKFDLVFAAMSGALYSVEAIKKFIAHSKNYCVVERFIRDRNSLEVLAEEISNKMVCRKAHNSTDYITALITLIMDLGYTFEVLSESKKWERNVGLNEIEERYPYIFDILGEDREKFLEEVNKQAKDNSIKVEHFYDRIAIIWKV